MSHPIRITLLLGIAACGGGSSVSRAPTEPQPAADDAPLPDDLGQLEQLCLGGRLDACDSGGYLSKEAGDNAKARDFYWFACERDHAEDCGWLANLEEDPVQKQVLEEKACRLGFGGSCMSLGYRALEEERFDDAERYLNQACASGSEFATGSCDVLESLRNR